MTISRLSMAVGIAAISITLMIFNTASADHLHHHEDSPGINRGHVNHDPSALSNHPLEVIRMSTRVEATVTSNDKDEVVKLQTPPESTVEPETVTNKIQLSPRDRLVPPRNNTTVVSVPAAFLSIPNIPRIQTAPRLISVKSFRPPVHDASVNPNNLPQFHQKPSAALGGRQSGFTRSPLRYSPEVRLRRLDSLHKLFRHRLITPRLASPGHATVPTPTSIERQNNDEGIVKVKKDISNEDSPRRSTQFFNENVSNSVSRQSSSLNDIERDEDSDLIKSQFQLSKTAIRSLYRGGEPGVDFPNLIYVPGGLSFSCKERNPGFYADVETGCQVYHQCVSDGRMYSHVCGIGTVFNQRNFVCDHWNEYNCKDAENDYQFNGNIFTDENKFGWERNRLPSL